jgi:hypothetical protein
MAFASWVRRKKYNGSTMHLPLDVDHSGVPMAEQNVAVPRTRVSASALLRLIKRFAAPFLILKTAGNTAGESCT